jgi:hypothetical protein
VLVAAVLRRVEVRVLTMLALSAAELALALSVGTLDMPTGVAPLARVARVDPYHPAAVGLRLVFQEGA